MVSTRRGASTRETILESANALVRDEGVGNLTLDAVAAHAGVSKGGLLYHYPNKDSLIEGMIEHSLVLFEQEVDRRADASPDGNGRWLRAFVEVTIEARPEHHPGSSILAAAATNPSLLAPVSTYFDRWHQRAISDHCHPIVASVVRLASDGLWFADMFTTTAPAGRERQEILQHMLGMVDEGCNLAQEGR
jgi:AcrR family transcriptional regulator